MIFGLFITLLTGSCVPFIFFLGILGLIAFLGHPQPFFLILHSHGFLLTLLGFPGPITLSFILGAHELFDQPLTFFTYITSSLLWPILTFLHHILLMGLLLLSLWAPLGPFASSRPICLFYRPMIHYSCHLGLMIFYPLTNSFLPILLGFFLLLGLPK